MITHQTPNGKCRGCLHGETPEDYLRRIYRERRGRWLRRLLRVLRRMVRWDDRCRAGTVAFGVRDYRVDALVDRARELLDGGHDR